MIANDLDQVTTHAPPVEPLPVMRSRLLATVPGVVHGITRRVSGMGLADGNLGYSAPRDTADAWAMRRRWSAAIGVDSERLASAGQIHGADAVQVRADQAGRGARPGSGRVGLADALHTDEPGVALLSLHADCLPLLLVDPALPAVAAVHAGWRGTVADVAGAAVRAMAAAYGSSPEALFAFLGPAIGPCCYKVGADVAGAWRARAGDAASGALAPSVERDHWMLDLAGANSLLLARAGLMANNVEKSSVCTRCAGGAWFSHRGQGATTGRFGAIIALTG